MFENNRVTKLLKIKYPVIQGGMAWVADADLAAAVSNAGGLGVIAAASMPPELLEQQILKIMKLTDKPFGMNIMLLSPTADDALEIARHAANAVVIVADPIERGLDRQWDAAARARLMHGLRDALELR